MNHYSRWPILLTASLGLGLSMPSCPGQKEMQQQLDHLQTQNTELAKTIEKLSTQTNGLVSEIAQIRQILPSVTAVLQAQKNEVDSLRTRVESLEKKKKR